MAKPGIYRSDDSEISLRKVRYFLAVAHHLNFGRAAEEMFIAQPALSRAIRSLEADLGVDLFERDHHSVALTPAGEAFVRDAHALLARVQSARQRLRSTAVSKVTLRIGFRPGIIVSDVVQRFTREHSDVSVVAQRIEWDEQHAAVLDDSVDVAWVRTPIDDRGLELVPLFDDPEMVAMPMGHSLAAQECVLIADLKDEAVLRYATAPEHVVGRPANVDGIRTMEEKLEAVALGHGLALVPATAAAYYQRPDIVYRQVLDAPPYGVGLATTTEAAGRREVAAFIATATGVYQRTMEPAA